MNDNTNFEKAYQNLKINEGGYTNGQNQIKDEETNMGITQTTLNRYKLKYSRFDMPCSVKDLTPSQAREIYKTEYWDNTNIPKINNERIRNAVFDMYVMGPVGAGKSIQRALNIYTGARLSVDGIIGAKTLSVLNSIPLQDTDDFMQILKQQRIENLKSMPNWPTAKNGWQARTNRY